MDLSDRKRKILQAVIEEYIGTAEPVGSRAISKKETLGLSSATIRNEMADLEEMGYLVQPHTSAGRVPSDEGYRFYVNSLMKHYRIGMEAIAQLQEELVTRVTKLDNIIKRAGLMTSLLTDQLTIIEAPANATAKISKVDLVYLGNSLVMLIVVTRSGSVKNQVINTQLSKSECEAVAAVLDKSLEGLSADEIDFEMIKNLESQIRSVADIHPRILINILNFVYETISAMDERDYYVNNVKSILKYPEYRDVGKASEMFGFLEDRNNLKSLIGSTGTETDGISVKIGAENDFDILKDCSLVTVDYSLGGKTAGKLGVIGPKRMNYSRVFAGLDAISREIDKILKLYIESE